MALWNISAGYTKSAKQASLYFGGQGGFETDEKIKAKEIADVVSRLCAEANYYICDDIKRALEAQREIETHPRARNVIDKLWKMRKLPKMRK